MQQRPGCRGPGGICDASRGIRLLAHPGGKGAFIEKNKTRPIRTIYTACRDSVFIKSRFPYESRIGGSQPARHRGEANSPYGFGTPNFPQFLLPVEPGKGPRRFVLAQSPAATDQLQTQPVRRCVGWTLPGKRGHMVRSCQLVESRTRPWGTVCSFRR